MKKLALTLMVCALATTAFGQHILYESDFTTDPSLDGWTNHTGGAIGASDTWPFSNNAHWSGNAEQDLWALGRFRGAVGDTVFGQLVIENTTAEPITNIAVNYDLMGLGFRFQATDPLASNYGERYDAVVLRVNDGAGWQNVDVSLPIDNLGITPEQAPRWLDRQEIIDAGKAHLDQRAILTGLNILPGETVTFQFGSVGGNDLPSHPTIASGSRRHVVVGFDELAIFQAAPGDATLDRRVDIDDAQVVLTNWQQTGMSWQQGDFTGDGTVGLDDASLLLGNWLAEYQPEANEATITLDAENMQLIIEANQIALIKVTTSENVLVPGSYVQAVAWTAVQQPTEDVNIAGEFTVSNSITGIATVDISALVGEATLEYQILGQDPVPVTILIPEPATMAILGLGGLGGLGVLLRRRRK